MWILKKDDETEEQARERAELVLAKVCLGLSAVVGIASLGCLGYSVAREHQLNKALKNAIAHVDGMTEVRISEGIVNRGVSQAVDREVGKVARKAADAVEANIRKQVEWKVKAAVDANYSELQRMIAMQVAREAEKIDKDDLLESVMDMAKDKVAEQFEGKLDDILEGYNKSLDNVGKIYQSIADSMSRKVTDTASAKGIKLELA